MPDLFEKLWILRKFIQNTKMVISLRISVNFFAVAAKSVRNVGCPFIPAFLGFICFRMDLTWLCSLFASFMLTYLRKIDIIIIMFPWKFFFLFKAVDSFVGFFLPFSSESWKRDQIWLTTDWISNEVCENFRTEKHSQPTYPIFFQSNSIGNLNNTQYFPR